MGVIGGTNAYKGRYNNQYRPTIVDKLIRSNGLDLSAKIDRAWMDAVVGYQWIKRCQQFPAINTPTLEADKKRNFHDMQRAILFVLRQEGNIIERLSE